MNNLGFGLAVIGIWGAPTVGMVYASVSPFMFLLSALTTVLLAIFGVGALHVHSEGAENSGILE